MSKPICVCEMCGVEIDINSEYWPVCSRACENEHIDRRASELEDEEYFRFAGEAYCGGELIGEIIDEDNGQVFEVLATC